MIFFMIIDSILQMKLLEKILKNLKLDLNIYYMILTKIMMTVQMFIATGLIKNLNGDHLFLR